MPASTGRNCKPKGQLGHKTATPRPQIAELEAPAAFMRSSPGGGLLRFKSADEIIVSRLAPLSTPAAAMTSAVCVG
jgi:hypothetical protein